MRTLHDESGGGGAAPKVHVRGKKAHVNRANEPPFGSEPQGRGPLQLPFEVQPVWWVWLRAYIRLFINFVGAAGITVLTGGHARFVAPYRPEFDQVAMPLAGLGGGLVGFRILQLADLHIDSRRSLRHLREMIERVNQMGADLVVVTGDLISSSHKRVEEVCAALGNLKPRTLVSFGNHDYNASPMPYAASELADALEAGLEKRGIEVLRNRAVAVERGGDRVWIVGYEDYWSGRFAVEPALAGLAPLAGGEPVIALSHNPDTGPLLAQRGVQWILAGHTHGGQIRLPGMRPLMLPIEDKRFASGLFALGDARMFVSRGLGQRVPVRFRCPPQVTTFILEKK